MSDAESRPYCSKAIVDHDTWYVELFNNLGKRNRTDLTHLDKKFLTEIVRTRPMCWAMTLLKRANLQCERSLLALFTINKAEAIKV